MTKPASTSAPCRPLALVGDLAAKAHRGEKTMTRRPVSALNSLIDGSQSSKLFARLWLAGAWVDQGPSPTGNGGPYLRATDDQADTTHRIYSRVQPGDRFWIREPATVIAVGADGSVGVAYDDDSLSGWFRWPSRMTWKPVMGHKIPNGCIREAARTVVTVTAVRPGRVQSITEADAQAEGIIRHENRTYDGGGPAMGLTPQIAFMRLVQSLYPGLWEENGWVWAYSWEPHKA